MQHTDAGFLKIQISVPLDCLSGRAAGDVLIRFSMFDQALNWLYRRCRLAFHCLQFKGWFDAIGFESAPLVHANSGHNCHSA